MSQITRLVPTSGPGSGSVTSVSGGNNITITGDPAVNPTVNVSGTTNHAVQVGNASGSLTSIPVGLTGQVLTGVTGGDPIFAAPAPGGVTSITGNTGAAQTGAISLVTANSTPLFAGSAGTITLDFDLTSNLLLGANATGLAGGTDNVGYGRNAGEALTTGSSNTFIGSFAGFQHTNASNSTGVGAFALAGEVAGAGGNTALGSQALQSVATGDFNLGLGFNGGGNYNGNESFNIAIANGGVIGETGVIRIGANGVQTSAYIAGIDGVNVGSVAKVVTMASDQLGTATITAGSGITVTPGANTITIASTGGSISITGDSGGALVGSAFTLTGGTTGLAFAGAGTTETLGGTLVVSNGGTGRATLTNHGLLVGAGTSAITQLGNATNGQLPIGSTGADPVLATITAGSGITVTNGAGSITIAATGGGGSTLTVTSVNNAASPYTVLGTDQFLAANTSGGAVTIRLPNAPTTGTVFYVKDSNGTAAASNVTVTTVGGAVNIDGATSFVMNTAYESISVVFDGSTYEVF